MKSFIQLFLARNKEFFRDKGSLSWAFILPVLIIAGCAIAFSSSNNTLLNLGYYPEKLPQLPENLDQPYSQWIAYNDKEKALLRLRHHELHALVDNRNHTIYINPQSTQSLLIRQLLAEQNDYPIAEVTGESIRYVDWVIPGVLGMNIMFGSLFGVAHVLVRYRKNGVLKRLQATPVSAFTFLAAQVASRLFLVVGSNAIIFLGSWYVLDLVVIGSVFNLLFIAIIGAMAMISVALLIACRTASEELASGLLNASTWPMMFLSGIWFSLDETPELMQLLANFLPLTHLVAAARSVMIQGASLADIGTHLFALALTCVLCLGLAAFFFRWNQQ